MVGKGGKGREKGWKVVSEGSGFNSALVFLGDAEWVFCSIIFSAVVQIRCLMEIYHVMNRMHWVCMIYSFPPLLFLTVL
jgi:hypothetical protein